MNRYARKLKRTRLAAATRTAALLAILFYIINVQSVHRDVPKQIARQDELETLSPFIQEDGVCMF